MNELTPTTKAERGRCKICKDCLGGTEHNPPEPDVWELIEEREGTDDNEQEDDQ